MEQRDLELINKFSSTDNMLADLYKQHLDFEHELEKLEHKLTLTADEQLRKYELKKQKLVGRDKIESILRRYRRQT